MGDHRPAACDHRTDRRKSRQAVVRRAQYRSRFRSPDGSLEGPRSRDEMPVVRFRDCDCGQNHRSRRRREPKDLANAGIAATAELVSVEPCLEPATCPSKPPPRHHAACQRGALFKRRCRRWPNIASIPTADRVPREHRPTRTSQAVAGSLTRSDVLVANMAPR